MYEDVDAESSSLESEGGTKQISQYKVIKLMEEQSRNTTRKVDTIVSHHSSEEQQSALFMKQKSNQNNLKHFLSSNIDQPKASESKALRDYLEQHVGSEQAEVGPQ